MRVFLLIVIIICSVALDQWTKYLVSHFLSPGEYISIVGNFIGLEYTRNTGIAFSLPIRGILLNILTVTIIVFFIIYYLKEEYPKRLKLLDIGYMCILGGAFSHAYDRIALGYVVDFISVKYFAIFNFADIFISTGAFFFILSYVREYRKHR